MSSASELVSKGHYARKQILCKDVFVAWSHGSRFRLACELASQHRGGKLLDYGFGDGTFLALVHHLFSSATGVESDTKQVVECAGRFSSLSGLSFFHVNEVAGDSHTRSFDLVTCMEVLEHCTPEKSERVLSDLSRLVTANGTVLISVPVETGPSLIAKQIIRRVAAWRGLGDYRYMERYKLDELCTMVFANKDTSIPRPLYKEDEPIGEFYGHKGFNWRAFQVHLRQQFVVERIYFSPAGWLRGYLSSQVWFACKLPHSFSVRAPGTGYCCERD